MSAQSIPTWYVWVMCCRLCGHVQHKRLMFVVCLFVCLFVCCLFVCLFVCLFTERKTYPCLVYVWKDWVQMYCMITTTQSSCTSHTHTHTQLVFPAANSSNIYYTFNEGQTFQVQSFNPSTIDPRSLLFNPTQLLWAIGHDIVNKKVNISLPTNIELLITTMLTSCVQQNWFGHRYVHVHKHGSSSVFSWFCMADVHIYLFH